MGLFKVKAGDSVIGWAIESKNVLIYLKANKNDFYSHELSKEDTERYYLLSKENKRSFIWMKTQAFVSSLISELLYEKKL